MKTVVSLILLIALCKVTLSQSWGLLPNSPGAGFRHDDIFFVNADTGWVVNVDGYIYKTSNGGDNFSAQLFQSATSFRCVGFANPNKGWAGNLGIGSWSPTTDTIPLYQTLDGGNSWLPVTSISGPLPTGICGINVLNDSIAFAVGRVGGPAYFLKTTDGGQNWTSTDLSSLAFSLIDCHFFSADTGIIIGSTASTSLQNAKALILYTTNGGSTWQTVYSGTELNQMCWKVSFTTRLTGYVSIESGTNNDSIPVLKSTDGGLSWNKQVVTPGYIWLQGVGFINDSTGWTGAGTDHKMTVDGGNTWTNFSVFTNFNRFRKVNDSIAYASGNRIWKYADIFNTLGEPTSLKGLILEQNYPNPFSKKTAIRYSIPKVGKVTLRVYDFAGRPVKTLVNSEQNAGTYTIDFSVPYYFDTHFFYSICFDNFLLTYKMLMIGK